MVKRILFVCVENAGRSQMAEAFARKFGKDKFVYQVLETSLPIKSTKLWFKLCMKKVLIFRETSQN
jgi:hypothetical protein